MSYRVSMTPQAANLLASAPPSVQTLVRRHLSAQDRERANAMKRARARLIFVFDEPMMLLEVGSYTVMYEMDPSSRTVRVRYATGPAKAEPKPRAPKARSTHRSSGGPSSC